MVIQALGVQRRHPPNESDPERPQQRRRGARSGRTPLRPALLAIHHRETRERRETGIALGSSLAGFASRAAIGARRRRGSPALTPGARTAPAILRPPPRTAVPPRGSTSTCTARNLARSTRPGPAVVAESAAAGTVLETAAALLPSSPASHGRTFGPSTRIDRARSRSDRPKRAAPAPRHRLRRLARPRRTVPGPRKPPA